ncbi:hypothetical protein [Elongatibacter sediminis]|uniref:Uncharacterized protein n=1 Tax=Elongatibacter sediminis TaxID=3119006 RepID=A0AAW9RFJ0_9GAMM
MALLARADEAHTDGIQAGDELADVITHQPENRVYAESFDVLGEDLVNRFAAHVRNSRRCREVLQHRRKIFDAMTTATSDKGFSAKGASIQLALAP